MIKRIAGTKDILPEETLLWQKIEDTSRKVFSIYNYRQIRTPIIEELGLFNRSLGNSTEIVQKQMFLIKKNTEEYALRPEGTASIVRAYLENNMDKTEPFVKLYYSGPMFRYERPQKGRMRQFHHIGAEAIGSYDPALDVEIISLADSILNAYGIEGYHIHLNSLGCPKDKNKLADSLRSELKSKTGSLCEDCKIRFKQNVLRVLDCKNEECQKIISALGINLKHLCGECSEHFASVKNGLEELGIKYVLTNSLVRGLDYYNRTVFEIKHPSLGAQDALGAGGRYDNLVEEIGGPKTGAAGFAFGVERLLLAKKTETESKTKSTVYIAALGNEAKTKSLAILAKLRKSGISSDTDYEGKSLKGIMRAANNSGARFVVILGENELKNNTVTVKDMEKGEQKEIPQDQIISILEKC